MINVLLTFDYELPLGGIHGTFNQSLFDPTEDLLALADKIDVPLNFFADILSYKRFLELNRKDYTNNFQQQMQFAFSKGHDVQLHLHPHWIDTQIEGNIFKTSPKYGLHNFETNESPDNIEGIVGQGVNLLKTFFQSANKAFQCIAYRGGGYVLSPATQSVLQALYKHGIRIDSSISKGYFFKSDRSLVDYTQTPSKANWFLNMNGELQEENSSPSGIFEIPIASKSKSILEMPTSFKMKRFAHRAPANRGVMIHENALKLSLSEKVKSILSARMLSFDNYTYSKDFPVKILRNYVKKYYKGDPIFLAVVSHPKSMGDYSFEMMEYFIEQARNIFNANIAFKTFTDVYKELKLQ